jgi:glycosyltransferase involved in cell wall biosynthesis
MSVAFVIPWFGRELLGGAEQHIFQVVTRLVRRGHRVDVLTTCCRSFHDDWQENHFPEGTSEESGVVVRRFPVAPRNVARFDAANAELLRLNDRPKRIGTPSVPEWISRTFVDDNIHSPKLLDYIKEKGGAYESIVFAPYVYGPTLLGVQRAGRAAILQPMLHDETYAYLPAVEETFHRVRRVLFNSEGESALALRLFGPSMLRKGVITGEGVEISEQADDDVSNCTTVGGLAPDSFVLYLGRRDPTKNTDLLLRAFHRYRGCLGGHLQLALAGSGDLPSEDVSADGVVDLGRVPEPQKRWLLTHCRALVQPSRNESYSRTIMEAWLHTKPVVAHSDCLATSVAVEHSGGGWTAGNEEEWANVLSAVGRADTSELTSRGERGRSYAREHSDWERALDRYEAALDLRRRSAPKRPPSGPRTIHQLIPSLAYGDAIANHATFICEVLRELGYESELFAENVDEQMSDLGRPFRPTDIRPRDGLLYHHSIGSGLTSYAARHAGPKALVYHNITPARFFEPWHPSFAKLLEAGRTQLATLASSFPVSCGVSEYNAKELREAGFPEPRVLPLFIDPMRWCHAADPHWMGVLQDGRTNILFVGRIAPNKCQHELVEAFNAYLSFDPDARLLLVGGWADGDRYAHSVRSLAERLGIGSQVVLARKCSDAQLFACYRTAHLFWSMSEHEGFCVPLIEAMWFDIPVMAFRSTAIPETLGPAGLMFTEKKPVELAALARLLIEDKALRRTIVLGQEVRRAQFLPERVLPAFLNLLERMINDRPSTVERALF